MTVTVRAATPADLPMILELERRGFEASEQWSETLWAQEISADDRRILVALDAAGHAAGVISVQVLPPDSDLMRIVVDPAQRRQGIATELIIAGLDRAAAEGADAMMLEVRYDNVGAIECYGRAGFEQLTTRPNYYGAGKDAMVMRAWDLQQRRSSSERSERVETSGDIDHG